MNVIFGACKLYEIPGITCKIDYTFVFTDFFDLHSMNHNDQVKYISAQYIWVVFGWVLFSKREEL